MVSFDIFSAAQSWLLGVLLLALRIGALLLVASPFASVSIPVMVRVAFGLLLAVLLAFSVPTGWVPAEMPVGRLMVAALSEVALGATLALGVNVAFAAFSFAGRLLDVQVGFAIGQVFDPVSQVHVTVLGSAFNQLAVVVFFLSDAHHQLLRGLAFSVERFPPGAGWALQQGVVPVLEQVSSMFALGFAMAAPVVFCLFLVEVGLGVLARNLPQMNMFVLAIPIKVVVGLAALSISFLALTGVMGRVHGSIFKTWEAVFR